MVVAGVEVAGVVVVVVVAAAAAAAGARLARLAWEAGGGASPLLWVGVVEARVERWGWPLET